MNSGRMMNWVFTWNNYTDEDIEYLKGLVPSKIRYLAFAREVGASGTPHLQGFLNLAKNQRFSYLKKLLPKCHIENMKGRLEDNQKYCSKEGELTEIGEKPAQGLKRKRGAEDITERNNLIKTMREEKQWSKVVEKEPETLLKYYSAAQKIHQVFHRPSQTYEKPEVIVLWGPTGVGKSRLARSYPETYFVKTALTEKWWDGYDGEPMVIWDDFRASDIKFNSLLNLIDGYGAQVQVKGAVIYLKPKKWVFTSCKPPELWYNPEKRSEEDINQLLRRISNVFHITDPLTFAT